MPARGVFPAPLVPTLPLALQWKLGAPWLVRHSIPDAPTVIITTSPTGNVIDTPGSDYAYSFYCDQSISGWKIKVVANATDPHTEGVQLISGGAVSAGVPVTGNLTWRMLWRAGQAASGSKLVKVFAKDLAGNWGGGDPASPAPFPSLLRVSDGVLVDENDAELKTLKGFNVHVAPTVGGEAFFWGQEHFTAMADAGARIVRMVCHWDVFQQSAGVAGINATAISSLDSSIAACEAVGMYVLLELHLNVSRTPAWAQTGGSAEWEWFKANARDLITYWADRYGKPSSPNYTKAVIGFCPNEPPSNDYEKLVATYETVVPWYRDIAPGWLIWVAPTAFGQGTPYPSNGMRVSLDRYLRLDTNNKGVVFATRDYFVYDTGVPTRYGPYQPNGAIAPDWQAPGTYSCSFGGTGVTYPNTAQERADHATYMAGWVSWKGAANGRAAIAVEEFSANFTGGEDAYIYDVVNSWRQPYGGPGTVAEIWWNYDVATRASNEFSPRPNGVWRNSVYGWLSNPEPPVPVSSLAVFNSVSRAEANDTTSYTSTGTSSWTHVPPGGEAHGVVVAILQPLLAADQVSGVTYAGISLTRIASYASASARIYLYFLGTAVPDGPQTVAMTTTGTSAKQAHCYLLNSDGRDMVVDSYTGGDQGTVANPTLTDTFTTSLASQIAVCAHCYGGALPPSQTAGQVIRAGVDLGLAHDPGAATGETTYRSGDPEGTTDVFGYSTLASAATLMGAVVVKEQPTTIPIGAWENQCTDPSFEGSNTNGFWTPTGGTLSFPTGVAGTDRTKACRVTATTQADPYIRSINTLNVEAGSTYTFMLNLLQLPAGATIQVAIEWKDQGFGGNGGSTPTPLTAVGQFVHVATAPINSSYAALTCQMISGGIITDTFTIDAALFVRGTYAGTYFDGTTAGASWLGTADNSNSILPV